MDETNKTPVREKGKMQRSKRVKCQCCIQKGGQERKIEEQTEAKTISENGESSMEREVKSQSWDRMNQVDGD